jgi:hypothetical protein
MSFEIADLTVHLGAIVVLVGIRLDSIGLGRARLSDALVLRSSRPV